MGRRRWLASALAAILLCAAGVVLWVRLSVPTTPGYGAWTGIPSPANTSAEGFATFDFGRTPLDNAGLRKFKMGWGPAEHRIEYVRHDRRSGRYAADSGAGPRWRGRLLRALPEPLLKLIGSVLYRHAA